MSPLCIPSHRLCDIPETSLSLSCKCVTVSLHLGDDRHILGVTLAGQLMLLRMVLEAVTRGRMGGGGKVTWPVLRMMTRSMIRLGVSHIGVRELVQGGGGGQDQGHYDKEEKSHDKTSLVRSRDDDDESPLTGENTPESWSRVKECLRTKPIYRCSSCVKTRDLRRSQISSSLEISSIESSKIKTDNFVFTFNIFFSSSKHRI